jgi:hypothetical protein
MEQSVLTPFGEQFLSDLIQQIRDCPKDYYASDLCEDWGLEHEMGTIRIPSTHKEYGRLTKQDSPPLLLKTAFGYPTDYKIRNSRRNSPPYFHHELYGEMCIWEEALQRGSPHTNLFAPIYQYDNTNYEWAVVGRATNILNRASPSAKQLEERANELGWAADDTEVGTFEGHTVAVDYGGWWRESSDWATGVHEQPIYEDEHWNYVAGVRRDSNRSQPSSESVEEPFQSKLIRFRKWLLSYFS